MKLSIGLLLRSGALQNMEKIYVRVKEVFRPDTSVRTLECCKEKEHGNMKRRKTLSVRSWSAKIVGPAGCREVRLTVRLRTDLERLSGFGQGLKPTRVL
jgi:hypothetical protein